MIATKENMKLSKADQAAIDSARRIYNIIGARIVDADMNVLGVIDGNGDSEILRDGKASYIQHASGLMSTCGVSTGSAIRLSRSNIVEKDLLMIHQASLEMRLRHGVNVVIDMLDKSFAAQPTHDSGEWKMVPVMPTDAMLAAAAYRTEDTGDDGALLNWQGMLATAPHRSFVMPDALIDEMWERSGHGTEREDIVRAFEAGVKFATDR